MTIIDCLKWWNLLIKTDQPDQFLEPETFSESYNWVFPRRVCFVSKTSLGNLKVSLVEARIGLSGAIGDVSTRKSGRAPEASVFLRELLFALRYAAVRVHLAAQNRQREICEMKEAVRPSPLPVAATWAISNASCYLDLIHRSLLQFCRSCFIVLFVL